MEDKTFLQLLTLVGGLLALIAVILLLLSPMLALVYIAFMAIVFTLLMNLWPRMRVVLTRRRQQLGEDLRHRFRKVTEGGTEVVDTAFHPEYQLVFTRHGRTSATIIDKENFVIGRKRKTCDLVIPEERVTKEHCCIVYRKYSHTYFIEDLNSTNGTYLGVRRLEPFTQQKLLDNAEITIADRTYRFTRIDPA